MCRKSTTVLQNVQMWACPVWKCFVSSCFLFPTPSSSSHPSPVTNMSFWLGAMGSVATETAPKQTKGWTGALGNSGTQRGNWAERKISAAAQTKPSCCCCCTVNAACCASLTTPLLGAQSRTLWSSVLHKPRDFQLNPSAYFSSFGFALFTDANYIFGDAISLILLRLLWFSMQYISQVISKSYLFLLILRNCSKWLLNCQSFDSALIPLKLCWKKYQNTRLSITMRAKQRHLQD